MAETKEKVSIKSTSQKKQNQTFVGAEINIQNTISSLVEPIMVKTEITFIIHSQNSED